MAKYTPLKHHFLRCEHDSVTLSFSEVETIIGAPLPRSAHEYREWWANEAGGRHVQAHSWMEAGYRVDEVKQVARQVRFARV